MHILFLKQTLQDSTKTITKADAAVLQQVAKVVKHWPLVLTTDTTEITEKPAAVCHHSGESDLLWAKKNITKLLLRVAFTTFVYYLVVIWSQVYL